MQDLKAANVDLKRSQAALEGYNRNLEGTVADRTLELQHKNDLLRAEVVEKERAQAEMRSAKDIAESATQMKSQFLGAHNAAFLYLARALTPSGPSHSQHEPRDPHALQRRRRPGRSTPRHPA